MNPFEGGIFDYREKLDDLYNYLFDSNDETKINKAQTYEPIFVYLMGFECVMDVCIFLNP